MQISYTEDQIHNIAKKMISDIPPGILCFYGPMGAGKTTLIKAMVDQLGADGQANSPSFGIVNEYFNAQLELIGYHFDFYRLNDEMEAYDIGIEDYFNTKAWVFIEWPEKIESILPQDVIRINIEVINDTTRALSY